MTLFARFRDRVRALRPDGAAPSAPRASTAPTLEEILAALVPEPASDFDCGAGRHEPAPIRTAGGQTLGYLCARCRARCDGSGVAQV